MKFGRVERFGRWAARQGWCRWLFVLLFAATLSTFAADFEDHDRARQALESGEILPLNALLEKANLDTPGRVLEVELDREDGRWIYEIKLLRQGGSVVKLWVDARNGEVIPRHSHGKRATHGEQRDH